MLQMAGGAHKQDRERNMVLVPNFKRRTPLTIKTVPNIKRPRKKSAPAQPVEREDEICDLVMKINNLQSQFKKLDQKMYRIWEPESPYTQRRLRNTVDKGEQKLAEARAGKLYNDTKVIYPDGTVEVGLIWKNKNRPQNNTKMGRRLFDYARRTMKKEEGILWDKFSENVQEWLANGFA